MKNLYWIRSTNFGDALNPILYRAITGKEPTWAEPGQPDTVLAIGSIAHCARPGNILWGTGCMDDVLELQCDKTTIARAVRGPLTAWLLRKRGVNIENAIFCDPALVLPCFIRYKINKDLPRFVVIPHYVDTSRAMQYTWGESYKIVSPMGNTEDLIRCISHAEVVITSSLHALIVAEAYDVPAVWVEFSDDIRGNGFKFWDYYLGTGRIPPSPVQIRGDQIPWGEINDRLYWWVGITLDMEDLCDSMLKCCPFV